MQKTLDFQKASQSPQNEVEKRWRLKKRERETKDFEMETCALVMKEKVSIHLEKVSWEGTGRSFRTSSENIEVGVWKTKWREFTTEITDKEDFPTKTQLAYPRQVGAGC